MLAPFKTLKRLHISHCLPTHAVISLVIWKAVPLTPLGLASILLFAIFSLSFYQIRKIYHYFIFCLVRGHYDLVWHSLSEGHWPRHWITTAAVVISYQPNVLSIFCTDQNISIGHSISGPWSTEKSSLAQRPLTSLAL